MPGPFQAAVLGLIQGITEFLPISSSAHLILASRWLGWPDQGLTFDMAAHVGSMCAVLVTLRHEIRSMLAAVWAPSAANLEDRRLFWGLVLATVPVAVMGLALGNWVETAGRSPVVIGTTSIVFGVLLWAADRRASATRGGKPASSRPTLQVALAVGLAQALALIPGTSRSGVTMTAGLVAGMPRADAVRFSFLLAIPVSLLVAAKGGLDLVTGAAAFGAGVGGPGWMPLLIGFATAAVSAYVAIAALLAWVQRIGFGPFVIYRLILGGVLLASAV